MEEHPKDLLTEMCQIVWGFGFGYKFDVETDERGYRHVFIRKTRGKKCSHLMTMSFPRESEKEVWAQFESFVRNLAVMNHTPLDEIFRMHGLKPPPPKSKKRQNVKTPEEVQKLRDAKKLHEARKLQEAQKQQMAQRQQDARMQQKAQKQHYVLRQDPTPEQEKMFKDRGPLI